MKRYLTTKELLERPGWEGIKDHDLVDLILIGELPAYHQDHDSVIDSIISYYKELYSDKKMIDMIQIEKIRGCFDADQFGLSIQKEIISDLRGVILNLLFKVQEIEAYESKHGVFTNGNTIIRKGHALTHANIVKRAYPNYTTKEAAREINARLAEENVKEYSEKHLIRIIDNLGFKPGKPGVKPKN